MGARHLPYIGLYCPCIALVLGCIAKISRLPRLDCNGRFRRYLVIPARSGKGPLTIRFADLRHRAVQTRGLLSSRPTLASHPTASRMEAAAVAGMRPVRRTA